MAPTTAEQTRVYMTVYYVALFCIFWYDWIVTLRAEWFKIWKARWTPIKVLYITTRYSVLMSSIFILQGYVDAVLIFRTSSRLF